MDSNSNLNSFTDSVNESLDPDFVEIWQWRNPEPVTKNFNVQAFREFQSISSDNFDTLSEAREFAKQFGLPVIENLCNIANPQP
jgi:hypothetical protein